MRYKFPAKCPYCKEESTWLFERYREGENFVDCEHCGETYVIKIKFVPETVGVYALVPQES